MLIDARFRPEVAYVRPSDIRRSFAQLRFSPRPRHSESIRKFTFQGSLDYVTDAPAIALQSKEAFGLFRIEFQSSDQFSAEYSHEYELLPARFAIAPGVIVPAGGYTYSTSRVSYSLGQQRKVSGRLSASTGTLYGGTKSDVSYSGRWGVVPQFSLEPNVTLAWGSLPYGDFTARLLGSRFTVTPSARMSMSSLVQFNVDAKTLTASGRLRWEYTGGSELFVVYSDGRDTQNIGFPGLLNRTFAIKATRLFRF